MATRIIRVMGDPVLNKKAKTVTNFGEKTVELIEDMLDTMYEAQGVGLAAPQVGILKRIVVIDVSEEQDDPIILINPEIIETSGEQRGGEGCLSVPGRQAVVTRPRHVTVQFQNRNGETIQREAEGFEARAICHEIDHLDGRLYLDVMERELTAEEIQSHIPEDDLE